MLLERLGLTVQTVTVYVVKVPCNTSHTLCPRQTTNHIECTACVFAKLRTATQVPRDV